MSESIPKCVEQEFRVGTVVGTVSRTATGPASPPWAQFRIRIQRCYRDARSGESRTTSYFFLDDLPKLELVARKIYEHILLQQTVRDP